MSRSIGSAAVDLCLDENHSRYLEYVDIQLSLRVEAGRANALGVANTGCC
jgi:hypothetical protein